MCNSALPGALPLYVLNLNSEQQKIIPCLLEFLKCNRGKTLQDRNFFCGGGGGGGVGVRVGD